MSIISILRKLGVVPPVSHDDISNAEVENIMRDHEKAVERVSASTEKIIEINDKLRKSIGRTRSSAFADLEQSIRGHHG